MEALEPGQKAPDFTLPDQNGKPIRLADFRGQTVVLYFYPEDDTPLCTAQACSLRDNFSAIRLKDAVVLGISPDTVESHRAFHDKFNLPFSILADPEMTVINRYGIWGTKKMYGNEVQGIFRHTYLIGPDGIITKIFRKVATNRHGGDVLKALNLLKQ